MKKTLAAVILGLILGSSAAVAQNQSSFSAGDGSQGSPSFTFQNDQTTGWYRSGSGAVTFSSANAAGVRLSGQNLSIPGNLTVIGTQTFTGDLTIGGRLVFTPAVAKIVGGSTSLLLNNNADNATNINITDAGIVSLRNSLNVTGSTDAVQFKVAANSTQTQRIMRWETSVGADLGGVLSDGTLFSNVLLRSAGALGIQLDAATSRLQPGATSFSIRNNANAADNLLVSDAGLVTIRSGLTVSASDILISTGNLVYGPATSRIVAGATSFAIRNNANSADNILVADAGTVTLRLALPDGSGGTGLVNAQGTVTTNGTAIAAGVTQAQPTLTVTGVTTASACYASIATALPATWQTGIAMQMVVTANTATLQLTNPTAGSITPVAQAVNIKCIL